MYIDGFVAAVPTANKDLYLKEAAEAAALFKSLGALGLVECWGDDVPSGTKTSFEMAVRKEPDETVVFAWVRWPDKATRDAAHGRMQESGMATTSFDMSRMIFGGFVPILET